MWKEHSKVDACAKKREGFINQIISHVEHTGSQAGLYVNSEKLSTF